MEMTYLLGRRLFRTAVQLATGDIVLIPAGSPFSLKTTGQQTASVLQVRFEALPIGQSDTVSEPHADEIAPGVIREQLAYGSSIRPLAGPFTFSIHQAT